MNASLLDAEMVWRVVLVSVLFAVARLRRLRLGTRAGASLDYARTLVVNLIVVMEIFYLFSVRYLHLTVADLDRAAGHAAPCLSGSAIAVLLQFAFTYAPFMQAVFATEAIAVGDGAAIVAIGAALLVLLEAEKWVRRALARQRSRA